MADLIDTYVEAKEAIFKHVGYKEDWSIIPLEDCRDDFWCVDKFEREWCKHSPKKEALVYWLEDHEDEYGKYGDCLYEDEIYTQRHLPKWVYRGKQFTVVCCDTKTDLNRVLRIFRNDHEVAMPKKKAASRG